MKDSTRYTHRYSITAADMDTRYRMTPSAVLLYFQDCWARYMACLPLIDAIPLLFLFSQNDLCMGSNAHCRTVLSIVG